MGFRVLSPIVRSNYIGDILIHTGHQQRCQILTYNLTLVYCYYESRDELHDGHVTQTSHHRFTGQV